MSAPLRAGLRAGQDGRRIGGALIDAEGALLAQLEHARARLMYHGDFDWPGLQIGNHVMRIWNVHPWRFSAEDYEAAAKNAPSMRHDLSNACVTASWGTSLMLAMQRHGIAVAEEAVAVSLLKDLSIGPSQGFHSILLTDEAAL